jgi:hypothetical protein
MVSSGLVEEVDKFEDEDEYYRHIVDLCSFILKSKIKLDEVNKLFKKEYKFKAGEFFLFEF